MKENLIIINSFLIVLAMAGLGIVWAAINWDIRRMRNGLHSSGLAFLFICSGTVMAVAAFIANIELVVSAIAAR